MGGMLHQVLCTGIACYAIANLGILYAWPSSTLELFSSNETVLHRPMTEMEISLFGSLSCIGALVGTLIAGFLLDIIGRKYCAMLCVMTHVIGWSMILVSLQVEVVLSAIFVSGLGGASVLIIPIFISEICEDHIRGTMTSGTMIFCNSGMLISYVLGGCLTYMTMVYMCLTLAVVSLCLLIILRKSPTFLMMKGLEKEAAVSFAFYRNAKVNSKEVSHEMDKLRRTFNAAFDDVDPSPEKQKLDPEDTLSSGLKPLKQKVPLWQFIRKSRSTRQAMVVAITLMTSAMFQGLMVLQVYAQPLFDKAVPNLSSVIALVIFSLVTILAGLFGAWLTDFAGRRNLMIYASFASGLCCTVFGTQLHILWAPHWVTALFIYLFTATCSFGAMTVAFVLFAEVFLPEVKSFMAMFCIEWMWLCNFIVLFIFHPLVSAIGLGPTFYLFAVICFFSGVFAAIYQPETNCLSVDAIQLLFLK